MLHRVQCCIPSAHVPHLAHCRTGLTLVREVNVGRWDAIGAVCVARCGSAAAVLLEMPASSPAFVRNAASATTCKAVAIIIMRRLSCGRSGCALPCTEAVSGVLLAPARCFRTHQEKMQRFKLRTTVSILKDCLTRGRVEVGGVQTTEGPRHTGHGCIDGRMCMPPVLPCPLLGRFACANKCTGRRKCACAKLRRARSGHSECACWGRGGGKRRSEPRKGRGSSFTGSTTCITRLAGAPDKACFYTLSHANILCVTVLTDNRSVVDSPPLSVRRIARFGWKQAVYCGTMQQCTLTTKRSRSKRINPSCKMQTKLRTCTAETLPTATCETLASLASSSRNPYWVEHCY